MTLPPLTEFCIAKFVKINPVKTNPEEGNQ